jgi:DNA-binding MarR family transcriptional regulator
MIDQSPLPTLLSHALVAFTIEFDNEFEHRMPHRTTDHGVTPGSSHAPWLVSLAMWENCMRFVGKDGVRLSDLEALARTSTNLHGMQRWGYVVVEPDSGKRRRNWLIRGTPNGLRSQEIWRPLFAEIEERWNTRFGKETIALLRESLQKLITQIDTELPDCLPMLRYGLFSKALERKPGRTASPKKEDHLALSALLSRVLFAFAIEFECFSDLSVAICANLLRILNEDGVRFQDLPRLSGVSKELIKTSIGFLAKQKYIALAPGEDKATKGAKLIRLTAKGNRAQEAYIRRVRDIEKNWQEKFG